MEIINGNMVIFLENELEEAEKKHEEIQENVWIESTCRCGYPVRTILRQYKQQVAAGERPHHSDSQHEWDDKFR